MLGLVSLLNDGASEMIAPLLPVFLTATLGAGATVVGLIEGASEAVSHLLKILGGRLADRSGRPRAFVLGGYGLASLARPLIGLATTWVAVLALRFLDRVGKGLRTAPRDAMIAGVADHAIRGRAFGLHRALDHTGAAIGPLLAFLLLQTGWSVRDVFLFAALPGVLTLLVFMLGVPRDPPAQIETPRFHWGDLGRDGRALIGAGALLALGSVPESFIVLWATANALPIADVPLLWAGIHVLRAVVATPGGMLSDRIGRRPVVLGGWALRVAVLLILATLPATGWIAWLTISVYALLVTLTEGPERALIGDAAPKSQRGTVYGLYYVVVGLAALPGALLFGALWQWLAPGAAFAAAAGLTALASIVLHRLTAPQRGA